MLRQSAPLTCLFYARAHLAGGLDFSVAILFRLVFLTFLFIKALTIDFGVEFADPYLLALDRPIFIVWPDL